MKAFVYLEPGVGGRGRPSQPSWAWTGTRTALGPCSLECGLNIAHFGTAVMFHIRLGKKTILFTISLILCMRIPRTGFQWIFGKNSRGKKCCDFFLVLIIGITRCQFIYDIHFINYCIIEILFHISSARENNSWSFWSRIQRTREVWKLVSMVSQTKTFNLLMLFISYYSQTIFYF